MEQKTFRKKIQVEADTSFLYRTIASLEKDDQIRQFYVAMGNIEETHARKLHEKYLPSGTPFALPRPSFRARMLAGIARTFGYNYVTGLLMDVEKSISSAVVRKKSAEGQPILGNEDRHVNILKSIGQLSGEKVRKIEGSHRSVGGNALRAAVLGANDGLVSNLSLVMGVAGATRGGHEVLIAGVAGLLAGSFSMALGEWISVKSSKELYDRQIEIETEEIENNPEEEKEEIILLYKAKGLSETDATDLAEKVFSDKENAKAVLIKEELGLDPEETKYSPMEAASASFLLFITGAVIPVFPFFFVYGERGILISILISTAALFLIGAAITLITGKSFFRSGIRQVLFGLAAAAITFGIGKLIGVAISG
ncbi:MAG TPA: VIT1/CCC1 transporter family protein [Bacteroidales bacterium]|nr:VIT1/CCC1 transporter family protein [Bacteroidales bacterium]